MTSYAGDAICGTLLGARLSEPERMQLHTLTLALALLGSSCFARNAAIAQRTPELRTGVQAGIGYSKRMGATTLGLPVSTSAAWHGVLLTAVLPDLRWRVRDNLDGGGSGGSYWDGPFSNGQSRCRSSSTGRFVSSSSCGGGDAAYSLIGAHQRSYEASLVGRQHVLASATPVELGAGLSQERGVPNEWYGIVGINTLTRRRSRNDSGAGMARVRLSRHTVTLEGGWSGRLLPRAND